MPTVNDDPHILGPGLAPTPFTADEIRRRCHLGRTIRVLVAPADAPAHHRLTRCLACDDDGSDREFREVSLDGSPLGPPRSHRSTWLELQAHASFPEAATTIARETIEIPIGRLDCLRYTVVDGAEVTTLWFALTKPGMPVRVVEQAAGRMTTTVTMIADDGIASDAGHPTIS